MVHRFCPVMRTLKLDERRIWFSQRLQTGMAAWFLFDAARKKRNCHGTKKAHDRFWNLIQLLRMPR